MIKFMTSSSLWHFVVKLLFVHHLRMKDQNKLQTGTCVCGLFLCFVPKWCTNSLTMREVYHFTELVVYAPSVVLMTLLALIEPCHTFFLHVCVRAWNLTGAAEVLSVKLAYKHVLKAKWGPWEKSIHNAILYMGMIKKMIATAIKYG